MPVRHMHQVGTDQFEISMRGDPVVLRREYAVTASSLDEAVWEFNKLKKVIKVVTHEGIHQFQWMSTTADADRASATNDGTVFLVVVKYQEIVNP